MLINQMYIRYQSVSSSFKLKSALSRLCPLKIDVWTVYNGKPSERKNLEDLYRIEVVFDIDLNDYDDVRYFLHAMEEIKRRKEDLKVVEKE